MKVSLVVLLFSFFSFLQFSSCSDSDSSIFGDPNGLFYGKVTMYDSTGMIQNTGIITINQTNSNELKGNWDFWNGQSGKLVGTIDNNNIQLNLNPNFVDNNTFLLGEFDGEKITGIWSRTGYPGVLDEGTFVAIRQ